MNSTVDAPVEEVFGSFEHVSIPVFGIDNVVAKIDTGAYSGALHCSLIEESRRDDGKKVLRFIPSDNHSHMIEVDKYFRTYVRSSTGHRVKRYLFDVTILIKEKPYTIRIGLTNRAEMQYEILIGRRFLRKNNIIVDVRRNQELDKEDKE
jgi:hypothetical protein